MPEIANKQKEIIRETIEDCFDNYYQEITKRINEDIKARQAELDRLLAIKETEGEQHDREIEDLKTLKTKVMAEYKAIEQLAKSYKL